MDRVEQLGVVASKRPDQGSVNQNGIRGDRRYRDLAGVVKWRDEMIVPDLDLGGKNKQMYMPVVFPGFSWHNLKRDTERNRIPRLRGEFLWRQAYNAKVSGATC